jgi:membrane protease YdiL (CAAX protease family)
MNEAARHAGLDETRKLGRHPQFENANGPLLAYWVFCLVFGFLFLRDTIFTWNVLESWQSYGWLALITLLVTLGSQWGYMLVARNNGRPVAFVSSITFIIVNGILEAFVFMGLYKIFFDAARLVFGDLNVINTFFGIFGFTMYSGFIHAAFWARLIPPHFTADPRRQKLRRLLTPIQASIVVMWCIYYQVTGDLWTVIFLHILVDGVLMFWVRPPVLFADRKAALASS